MKNVDSVIPLLSVNYDKRWEEIYSDFSRFLAFESVSSEAEYKSEVLDCANWLRDYLEAMGLKVSLWETSGHPVVFAVTRDFDASKPTVMIYNHYDVQPVSPLEAWASPPFKATIRDGEIFARGAQDNKGQCFYAITAIKHYLEQLGSLPVNIKLLIEGEEETSSHGLSGLLASKREELCADYLLILDVGFESIDAPAVSLGLRGIATMTVNVRGSNVDLHSGTHGGIVYNPIHALVELLSKLRDESGRIAVPGFYDDVEACSPEFFKEISFEFDHERYCEKFGAKALGGEKSCSPKESAWLRPTIEINGIAGGYAGEGFKTVIPAVATAKISCRLVPNQDPEKIKLLVKDFLEKNCSSAVEINVDLSPGGGKAVRTNSNSLVVRAAHRAFSEIMGVECQYVLEGASIPIVVDLTQATGADVVLLGYGLPDDNIHAPNEHFGVKRFKYGYLTIARILELLGQEVA
ncbi:MAG: dipeptidase [Deltaproteobacteria bacterium]|nr:dipeptidase [Deltaproteobacteria bacterium]